jgi:hypothetical protein
VDAEATLCRRVVAAQLSRRRGLRHADARQAPRRAGDRREVPPAEHRVARLAPDVAWQPGERRVAECAALRHQPQHALVVERQVRDLARHLAGPVPAPQRLMQPSRRGGQRRGKTGRSPGERRVRRRKRLCLWRLRGSRRLPGIGLALLRDSDRQPGRSRRHNQDGEYTSHRGSG